MKSLTKKELEIIAEATYRKTAEVGLKHARANKPHIRRTIADLPLPAGRDGSSALVVSAGPSLHLRRTAERIRRSGFRGLIVAADGALGHCLRSGLVPDYVVCVDPHPHRIVRWFGDTRLESRPEDDYFRRQDLDVTLRENEVRRNRELIELVNRHGPRISALLSTSVAPSVTERVLEAGMPVYWWNPIYDDYDDPGSYTRRIHAMTGAPCLATGGNGGTSAWVLAGCVLKARHVAITGMDLSYHPDTPLRSTQYYVELKALYGDGVAGRYIHLRNPHLKQTWYTDPTYWWYRQCFLEMARAAPFTTYNCTEGGILFGKGVRWTTLEDFIGRMRRRHKKGGKGHG